MGEPDDRWDDEEVDDDFDEADANCGSRGHRQCDLAGTEYCDWFCPLRNEVFPPRRLAATP